MGRPELSSYLASLSSLNEYATTDDFQELFASDVAELFRLGFLLTADAGKAELCLLLTMQECLASCSVFKWWLPVWTRNAVMRNALRIVTGTPICSPRKIPQYQTLFPITKFRKKSMATPDDPAGILQLNGFDRIVYVISIIEQYSIADCAALLGRTRQEVREAQHRAVVQIAAFEQSRIAPLVIDPRIHARGSTETHP